MGLPACQQRILDGIAGALQDRDPRLASMFAIFTRLTRTEPMPVNEVLDGRRLRLAARRLRRAVRSKRRLRALLIVPVVLAAIAGLLVLGPVSGTSQDCGRGLAGRAFVELAGRFGTCQRPAQGAGLARTGSRAGVPSH